MFVNILCFLCLVQLSVQRSTPESNSYVAGVVEYQVNGNAEQNLLNYLDLIQSAAQQDVDIIVFPELTLTNSTVSLTIPIYGLLKEKPVPADYPNDYDVYLVELSKAARQHQIYVVVNGAEVVDCSTAVGEDCPEEKLYHYNTNFVFDRTGAIVDRYRKINLFGEYIRTPGKSTELGLFTTDFGVTFGQFICFDLLFQVPAVQLVEKYNVTDIVFSTMWFSETPYLVSTSIQEAYAYALNVNFLGAGANNVRIGSGGSGIYSGTAGALVSIMPGQPTTRLLVSRVPKIPGLVANMTYPGPIPDDPATQDDFHLIIDPSIPSHVSKLLTPGFQEIELTHNQVTCKIRANLVQKEGETNYYYRAGAFDGVRTFSGKTTGGARICSVFACTNTTIASCHRFDKYSVNATAIFQELVIVATVPTPVKNPELLTADSKYFPVSLESSLLPVDPKYFQFTKEVSGDKTVITYSLNERDPDLYSFAVWGRVFDLDGEEPTPPEKDSSVTHLLSNLLFLPVLLLCFRD